MNQASRYRPDVLPFNLDDGILKDAIRVASSVHDELNIPEWSEIEGRPLRVAARNRLAKLVKPKEQEALFKWANESGHLISNSDFNRLWKEQGKKGETENEVFYDKNKGMWFKRNDLSYHDSYLGFLQRVALHNRLFPEASLALEGFMVDYNRSTPDRVPMLKPVISQRHIPSSKGAEPHEVEKFMSLQGYEKINQTDYYDPVRHIRVEDLHNENVLIHDGTIYIIDPVIFLDEKGKQYRLKGSVEDATKVVSKSE